MIERKREKERETQYRQGVMRKRGREFIVNTRERERDIDLIL